MGLIGFGGQFDYATNLNLTFPQILDGFQTLGNFTYGLSRPLREVRVPQLRGGRGARHAGREGSRLCVARAETVECAAAVEIAALCGDAPEGAAREVLRHADRLVALLTGLVR